jgi:hypothetical protein
MYFVLQTHQRLCRFNVAQLLSPLNPVRHCQHGGKYTNTLVHYQLRMALLPEIRTKQPPNKHLVLRVERIASKRDILPDAGKLKDASTAHEWYARIINESLGMGVRRLVPGTNFIRARKVGSEESPEKSARL